MSEERMKILQLLADGKVTAEQASELLAATKDTGAAAKSAESDAPDIDALKEAESADVTDDNTIHITESDLEGDKTTNVTFKKSERSVNNGKARWLRIRVADANNERQRVRIDIPLGLVRFGLKLGQKFSPDIDGLEWSEIEQAVTSAEGGLLINVEDEDEHVQIYVE
ncbi:MAG: hypothetical protein M9928_09030 [Anaerolineae bacterium]|nr:hypothetical protein [Anaerolineae bacterium]